VASAGGSKPGAESNRQAVQYRNRFGGLVSGPFFILRRFCLIAEWFAWTGDILAGNVVAETYDVSTAGSAIRRRLPSGSVTPAITEQNPLLQMQREFSAGVHEGR
jgi:hypothetical protein